MGKINIEMNKFGQSLPRGMAEKLPADFAIYAMHRHEARQKPAGLFHSAWSHVEYALSRQVAIDDDMRIYGICEANNIIGRALRREDVSKDTELALYVLSTYIPVFAKRAVGEQITRVDSAEIYASLGAAMKLMSPLSVDEPPQWAMLEVAALALSARSNQPDLLLYPTSPREESSQSSGLNHDSYFLTDDDKIPVQQKLIKTSKQYDQCMTMLTFLPIVDRAVKKTGIEIESTSERLNYLLSLIVAQAHGEALMTEEHAFLNHMTAAVVSHRWLKKAA